MTNFNSDVDTYIAKADDFAKPILEYWRYLVHETCPDVVESVKWSIPHFDYKGDFMCTMAAHTKHCSFSFIKAPLMPSIQARTSKSLKPVQRFMGKVAQISDLPPDHEFVDILMEAMKLNENGVKMPVGNPNTPKVIDTPSYFSERLADNPTAKDVFESKSPSFRKSYIVWITDAKTEETREKRIELALEWIAEGKDLFWQYKK